MLAVGAVGAVLGYAVGVAAGVDSGGLGYAHCGVGMGVNLIGCLMV